MELSKTPDTDEMFFASRAPQREVQLPKGWMTLYFLFTVPYLIFIIPLILQIFILLSKRISAPIKLLSLTALHIALSLAFVLAMGMSYEDLESEGYLSYAFTVGILLFVFVLIPSGIQSFFAYKTLKAFAQINNRRSPFFQERY